MNRENPAEIFAVELGQAETAIQSHRADLLRSRDWSAPKPEREALVDAFIKGDITADALKAKFKPGKVDKVASHITMIEVARTEKERIMSGGLPAPTKAEAAPTAPPEPAEAEAAPSIVEEKSAADTKIDAMVADDDFFRKNTSPDDRRAAIDDALQQMRSGTKAKHLSLAESVLAGKPRLEFLRRLQSIVDLEKPSPDTATKAPDAATKAKSSAPPTLDTDPGAARATGSVDKVAESGAAKDQLLGRLATATADELTAIESAFSELVNKGELIGTDAREVTKAIGARKDALKLTVESGADQIKRILSDLGAAKNFADLLAIETKLVELAGRVLISDDEKTAAADQIDARWGELVTPVITGIHDRIDKAKTPDEARAVLVDIARLQPEWNVADAPVAQLEGEVATKIAELDAELARSGEVASRGVADALLAKVAAAPDQAALDLVNQEFADAISAGTLTKDHADEVSSASALLERRFSAVPPTAEQVKAQDAFMMGIGVATDEHRLDELTTLVTQAEVDGKITYAQLGELNAAIAERRADLADLAAWTATPPEKLGLLARVKGWFGGKKPEAAPAAPVPPGFESKSFLSESVDVIKEMDKRFSAYVRGELTESEQKELAQNVNWARGRKVLEVAGTIFGARAMTEGTRAYFTQKELDRLLESAKQKEGRSLDERIDAAKAAVSGSKYLTDTKKAELSAKLEGIMGNLVLSNREYDRRVEAILDEALERTKRDISMRKEAANTILFLGTLGVSGAARSVSFSVGQFWDRYQQIQYERTAKGEFDNATATRMAKDAGESFTRGFKELKTLWAQGKLGKAAVVGTGLKYVSLGVISADRISDLVASFAESGHSPSAADLAKAFEGAEPSGAESAAHPDAPAPALSSDLEAPPAGTEAPPLEPPVPVESAAPPAAEAPAEAAATAAPADSGEAVVAATVEQGGSATVTDTELNVNLKGGETVALAKSEVLRVVSEVKGGDGITTVLTRQIEQLDSAQLQAMGFKGDLNNQGAVHLFAMKKAFEIADANGMSDAWLNKGSVENAAVVLTKADGEYHVRFIDLKDGSVLSPEESSRFLMKPIEGEPEAVAAPGATGESTTVTGGGADASSLGASEGGAPLAQTDSGEPMTQAEFDAQQAERIATWNEIASKPVEFIPGTREVPIAPGSPWMKIEEDPWAGTYREVPATAEAAAITEVSREAEGAIDFPADKYTPEQEAMLLAEASSREREVAALRATLHNFEGRTVLDQSAGDGRFVRQVSKLIATREKELAGMMRAVEDPVRSYAPNPNVLGHDTPERIVSIAIQDVENNVKIPAESAADWAATKAAMQATARR